MNKLIKICKVTSGGRITIPAELRKKFGLTPGREVKFAENDDGIRIIPLVTKKEIRNNIGFLGTGEKLLKALMEEKRREREE